MAFFLALFGLERFVKEQSFFDHQHYWTCGGYGSADAAWTFKQELLKSKL